MSEEIDNLQQQVSRIPYLESELEASKKRLKVTKEKLKNYIEKQGEESHQVELALNKLRSSISGGGGNNNDSPNGNSNNNNTTGMVRNTRSSFTSIEDMPMIAQIKESRRNLMGGRPSSPSTAKNRLRSQSSSLDDDSFGEDDEGYVETMETLSLSTLEKHLEQLKLSEDILAEYESCRNIQIDHNHGQWYLSYVAEDRMWHLTGISFYVSLKPGLDLVGKI